MLKTRSNMLGFSLVELMIAIALGLVALAAVTSVMVSTLVTNSSNVKMIRLDQELRTVMQMMTRDIRRAGYWLTAVTDIGQNNNTNPFMLVDTSTTTNTTDIWLPDDTDNDGIDDCIFFSYDLDNDGALDSPTELFGFKRASNAVRARNTAVDCNSSGWETLTDENAISITDLEFTYITTGVNIGGTMLTDASVGGVDARIIMRQVNVALTGQVEIDDATVSRTIEEQIKVRNHRFIPAQ